MARVLLYVLFFISVLLMVLGAWSYVRASRGITVGGGNGDALPRWFLVFVFLFGCLGVLSTAPSIFSDNPHWFVDKIYFAVSRLLAVFH